MFKISIGSEQVSYKCNHGSTPSSQSIHSTFNQKIILAASTQFQESLMPSQTASNCYKLPQFPADCLFWRSRKPKLDILKLPCPFSLGQASWHFLKKSKPLGCRMKCADRSNGRRASSPNRLGSLDVYANLDPFLKGMDMESTSQALQGCKGFKSSLPHPLETRGLFSALLPGFWSSMKSTELELCTSMATQLMRCCEWSWEYAEVDTFCQCSWKARSWEMSKDRYLSGEDIRCLTDWFSSKNQCHESQSRSYNLQICSRKRT